MSNDQENSKANVVQPTVTTIVTNNPVIENPDSIGEQIINKLKNNIGIENNYLCKAIPKTIKFSSRASIKIVNNGEHYYTVEYGEEREIPNFDDVNIDKERQMLIDDCNQIVDKQVEEIVKTFLK